MQEIKIYKSKKVGLFLVFTSLIIVIIGILLLAKTDVPIIIEWANLGYW